MLGTCECSIPSTCLFKSLDLLESDANAAATFILLFYSEVAPTYPHIARHYLLILHAYVSLIILCLVF